MLGLNVLVLLCRHCHRGFVIAHTPYLFYKCKAMTRTKQKLLNKMLNLFQRTLQYFASVWGFCATVSSRVKPSLWEGGWGSGDIRSKQTPLYKKAET